jgi:hypothetical protein
MTTNRREVLKGTIAVFGQAAVQTGRISIAAVVASCGGGGGGGPPPVQAPSGLSYAGPMTGRVAVPVSPLSPSVSGSVTSYSVSPALPAGISLNTSSGVISGTPTAAVPTATYTITASNSVGSATYALSAQVLGPVAIANLSSASPTALTPLMLTTTGIDPTQPVTVNFTVGSNEIAGVVIRTQSDGSIVVTTPLWIDPTSGLTASAAATVTVTQSSLTSNAMALTISDMPSVASYGETPGAITRSVLNFMAISMGRSINRLQAYAQVKSITTDTTPLQSALRSAVSDAQVMRGNIDRLLVGAFPALVIGTAPTGETLQFDMNSVDVMDRMLGLHLQALGFYPNTAFSNSAPPSMQARARSHVQFRPSLKSAVLADELGQLAGAVGFLGGAVGALTPNTSENTTFDRVVGGLNGLASAVALGATALEAAPIVITGAVAAGVVLGAVVVGRDIYNIYNSPEGATGLDYAKVGLDVATTITGAFGAAALEGAGTVAKVATLLHDAGSTGALANEIQIGGLIANMGSLAVGAAALGKAVATSAQSQSPPPPFGDVTGTASVANSQGAVLSGLAQINLTDPSSGTSFSATCDVNGNYSLTVPLDASTINYIDMQLTTSDPVTGTVTSSPVPVDLSGLTANGTDNAPTVNGMCNDTDAANPDSDDPDCD